MKLLLAARGAACLLLVAALSACASLHLPSLQDKGLSPRTTTLNAADKIEPVLVEVTDLLKAGVVPQRVVDDVAKYGPVVGELVGAYFDLVEACEVIDGALISDPATGRACDMTSARGVFDAVDARISAWAQATGPDTDAGRAIAAIHLVAVATTRPASGGVISGYQKTADVPLADFQARRARLRATFQALLAAASAKSSNQLAPADVKPPPA